MQGRGGSLGQARRPHLAPSLGHVYGKDLSEEITHLSSLRGERKISLWAALFPELLKEGAAGAAGGTSNILSFSFSVPAQLTNSSISHLLKSTGAECRELPALLLIRKVMRTRLPRPSVAWGGFLCEGNRGAAVLMGEGHAWAAFWSGFYTFFFFFKFFLFWSISLQNPSGFPGQEKGALLLSEAL